MGWKHQDPKTFREFKSFLLLFFLTSQWGMWDLRSPTRDGTHDLQQKQRVLTAGLPGKPQEFSMTFYSLPKKVFFFISWRLITLQYCSGFCHTLTWISLGFTCVPHPDPPSHFPLHAIPLGLPSAPGPSTCLMHPTWAGDLFHPR